MEVIQRFYMDMAAFNVSLTPVFNISNLNLFPFILEHNGVCAVANIRGGGELGERWHRLGKLESKQNGFDDFQSAAEFLISEKYTSSDHLAIYGRSNGGLLVGACLVQRPDLFKVAFPAVGGIRYASISAFFDRLDLGR